MKWLWGVLIAVVVGVAVAIWLRRNPAEQIKREFEAVNAETAAKLDVLKNGAVATRKAIEQKHAEQIRGFDDAQQEKYDRLRADPVALARWLTRISG